MTVRHTEVTDEVKDRTDALVRKLEKFDSRLSRVEVVFDEQGNQKTVEGILHIDRDDPVVAKAEAGDMQTAVDQMVDKLAKILRRRRSQVVDRRHKAPPPQPAVEADAEI